MRVVMFLVLLIVLSACASRAEREASLAAEDDATCRSYGLAPAQTLGQSWSVPTIQEFRAAFPAYRGVPNVKIAEALYRRYYSGMPRELFDQAFFHGPGLQGRTIQEALAGPIEIKSDGQAYTDCRQRLAEIRARQEVARDTAISASAINLSRTLLEPSQPPQSNTTFYNFDGNPMTCTRYQNVVNCF